MDKTLIFFLNVINIAVAVWVVVYTTTKFKELKTRLRLLDEDRVFTWCEIYREERIKYAKGQSTGKALRTIKMMLYSVLCGEFDSEYFLDIEDVFEEFVGEE